MGLELVSNPIMWRGRMNQVTRYLSVAVTVVDTVSAGLGMHEQPDETDEARA